MKNNTRSVLTIEQRNVDQAVRLYNILVEWFDIAGTGGDAHMLIHKGDTKDVRDLGCVGHDVDGVKIKLSFADIVESGRQGQVDADYVNSGGWRGK